MTHRKFLVSNHIFRKPEWHCILGKSLYDDMRLPYYHSDQNNAGRYTFQFYCPARFDDTCYYQVEHREFDKNEVTHRMPKEGDVYVYWGISQRPHDFDIMEPGRWRWYQKKLKEQEEHNRQVDKAYAEAVRLRHHNNNK